jgi:hypothetical protein
MKVTFDIYPTQSQMVFAQLGYIFAVSNSKRLWFYADKYKPVGYADSYSGCQKLVNRIKRMKSIISNFIKFFFRSDRTLAARGDAYMAPVIEF